MIRSGRLSQAVLAIGETAMRQITAAILFATAVAIALSFAPVPFAPATQDTLAGISPSELTRTATGPESPRWDAH